MRIIDRKEFLGMPPGTVFAKFIPFVFDDICIKCETCGTDDFFFQPIADAVHSSGSDCFSDALRIAMETKGSVAMDLHEQGRDGCYDKDQLFAVWERTDVLQLIARLNEALSEAY